MSSLVQKRLEIIPKDTRSLISKRYKNITSAVNKEFWNLNSNTANSLYVGSYGRGTAIDTSDLDVLICLPKEVYNRYDIMKGNGQSRLLQAVKNSIVSAYPRTDIKADGQVIKVRFFDGMKFEILPAFKKTNLYYSSNFTYEYPDSNMGGNWLTTDPIAEQDAMKKKNTESNGLLFDTCKHIRFVRDNYFKSYHLSGIVIDSFAYNAIQGWRWLNSDETSSANPKSYEQHLYDYFYSHYYYNTYIKAPGSEQIVEFSKSKDCLLKVLKYMA